MYQMAIDLLDEQLEVLQEEFRNATSRKEQAIGNMQHLTRKIEQIMQAKIVLEQKENEYENSAV